MTQLIGIHCLSKSYGTQRLFQEISFSLCQGDKVGLIGPNGSGKSTLLKILVDIENADSGSISRRQGLRIGYASQTPEFPPLSLEEILLQNAPIGDVHELQTEARILLGKVGFKDPRQQAETLSGGWKKRLDIARALMKKPDILLLDEPTNHLDLEGILWLEQFLQRERLSFLVVSHDRYFLENVSTKVIELNKCFPGGLFICQGNLSTYMERKEDFLHAQGEQERALTALVREEIEWLRKSPKARTTKSQARIQRAHELMGELSQIKQRNKQQRVDLDFTASERETRKLISAKNLGKTLGEKPLFKGVDITLTPGSCLGIVGANGTGKTTLMKILAGQITQDQGTVKYADDLKLVYFDQHREHIPSHLTLREALSPNSDVVNFRGQPIHVSGWAKKFLFSPDRLLLPVSCLSGGERARLLIARLMLEPADVLFLDEPTNDLDIPTLEVIEESLRDFTGAVVLISHDRCLMDKVCTQVVGLGTGCEHEIFADYAQWEEASKPKPVKTETQPKPSPSPPKPISKKLSYHEQRELDGMEKSIEQVEELVSSLQLQLDDPAVGQDATKSLDLYRQLADAQHRLERLFARWEELDTRQAK